MRLASWLPRRLILKLDHIDFWPRQVDGFSFWTDTSYLQYCRRDNKGKRITEEETDDSLRTP
jgi:hypothetical protein